ncbi:MAG: hypothetical protein DRI89_13175 [Bacteroidetes bacterium]|nr:MAG: hypothetical protein DRI89_13175 [Bacteroidota bacterium]
MITLVLMLITTACGKDGNEGKNFLQISWDPYVDAYWDDNSDTPDTIIMKKFYRVYTGIYHFEYICHDMLGNPFGFEGTYEIIISKGSEGKFLSSGKDGENKYNSLYLSRDGHDFFRKSTEIKSYQTRSNSVPYNSSLKKTYVGKLESDTSCINGFMIVINSQKFLLKVLNQ